MNDRLDRGSLAKKLVLALVLALGTASVCKADGFDLGSAASYALLFTGGGSNTLQVTNVTINGNVGVGGTGLMTDSGPSIINGTINFAAANTGQFSNNNAADVFGGPNYGVGSITSAFTALESLNSTLGSEAGTAININGNTTINANSGTLDASGNRVFTVTGFNTTNSNVLTINGAAGQHIVLNFKNSVNFNNQVVLTGGITANDVLYNFAGGSNLSGGPTLQINDNASSSPLNIVQGIFLDPNGAVSVTNADVLGGVYGGDSHDFQYVSGSTISSVTTVPEPSTLALMATGVLALLGFARRRLSTSA